MTKTTGNFTDFLDFSRNTGGTCLRRIAYGSELVTNGDFDTDSDWTLYSGVTISGGKVNFNATDTSYISARPSSAPTFTAGKIYQISIDVDSVTSGGFNVFIDRASDLVVLTGSSSGTYSGTFVADGSEVNLNIARKAGTQLVGVFDNISVKEVTLDAPSGDLVLFNHPNNVPRVEYDTNGNVKGLLIEETRTNVVGYSEDTSQWSEDGTATITNSTQIAPDGTASATLVDIGSTGSSLGPNRISRFSSGLSASTKATVSVFLKKPDTDAASRVNVRLYCSGTTATDMYVDYDTSDFTSVNSSGVVDTIHASEDYGNGWFRISFTGTLNASATGANNFRLGGVVSGSHPSTGTDVIMWGAQVETGSFATSYIPTSGATATRSLDVATIDIDNFGYNNQAASVLVEFSAYSWADRTDSGNFNRVWEFGGGGPSSNADGIFRHPAGIFTDEVRYRFNEEDGTTAALGAANLDRVTGTHKVCVALGQDDAAICMDGGTVATGSGTAAMALYTGIDFGGDNNVTALGGHIKSFQYYPRRLTNAQLQELTS